MDERTIDAYADDADDFARQYESTAVLHHCQLFLQHFRPHGRILEIGSGSGRDAAFLMAHGFDVVGVDATDKLIETAVRLHPELAGRLLHSPAPFGMPLPFPTGSFDGAISMATIMHLSDAQLRILAQQLSTLLADDAILIVSSSSGRTDLTDLRDSRGRLYHERTVPEIVDIFTSQQFEIIEDLTSTDMHGRTLQWHELVFRLPSSQNACIEPTDDLVS